MPGSAGLAIAGLWYVLLGLAAPAVALRRSLQGRPPRWALALRSFAVSLGMVVAFVVVATAIRVLAGSGTGTVAEQMWPSSIDVLGRTGVWLGLLLACVLFVVQAVVAVERRRRRHADRAPGGAGTAQPPAC
jgi:uncharacterized BrkB/YihY/UPF0761 family membrane protein